MGTLCEGQHTFLIISHSVFLRIRNISDKSYIENQNTHFMLNNIFFISSENRAAYEIHHSFIW